MSKFSDGTCEELHDLSLDGCLDGECGNVADGEWFGLLVNTGVDGAEHAILREDDQGFVTYEIFDSEDEARAKFEEIEEYVSENSENSEDE